MWKTTNLRIPTSIQRQAWWTVAVVWLVSSLLAGSTVGQAAVRHPPPDIELFEDSAGRLRIEQVATAGGGVAFRPVDKLPVNIGISRSAFWLRIRLPALPSNPDDWLLQIGTPMLDDIHVHIPRAGGDWDIMRGGDLVPYDARPYPHQSFVFPLPRRDTDALVYVRIASDGGITLPVRILQQKELLTRDVGDAAFYAAYFAILLTLLIYNAFLLISVRDASYLFYVLYLACFGLLQFSIDGWAARFLWSNAGGYVNQLYLLTLGGSIAAGAGFVQAFLQTRHRPNWLHRMLTACWLAALLVIAAAPFLPYRPLLVGLLLISAVLLPTILVSIVLAHWRGYRPARFLLLAFGALVPGCTLYLLRTAGLIESSTLTEHAIEVSTAFEALLLSFALADRINVLQAEKHAAESEAARVRERFSQQLIRSQETDRRRIAGELHDSIGQNLLVIANSLRRLVGNPSTPDAAARLTAAIDIAQQTTDEVRDIARQLHPQQLERLGLSEAVRVMLQQVFDGSAISVDSQVDDIDALVPAERAIHLYRVAQEAATNVLRHADARHCRFSLRRNGARLRLLVEDDGQGMMPRSGPAEGFGLTGQRERVNMLGGRMRMRARDGGGTVLDVDLPVGDA